MLRGPLAKWVGFVGVPRILRAPNETHVLLRVTATGICCCNETMPVKLRNRDQYIAKQG